MSTDFTSPAGNTHPAHPSHTLIHISIFSNMNSFSKRFSDHRPSCNAVGAGFSSCLVHFLQVWEQRSDRAVHFSFITLYTTQHHHQLYPLNPDRAVTKALRPHTVYLFIGPGCAHSLVLLWLASTTSLGQSTEQGVCSCRMLGDCTEQTLHVTTRKFTCHGTGSGKGWGISAESAPNVKKYVEPAAVVAAVLVLVGGWVCLLPFLWHNFRLENTLASSKIQYIYIQHYDANTNIDPSITKHGPDIHHCQ